MKDNVIPDARARAPEKSRFLQLYHQISPARHNGVYQRYDGLLKQTAVALTCVSTMRL